MSDYEKNKAEIENTIRVGIAAEEDDEFLGPVVSSLTNDQVKWVSAWLASESFGRNA